MAGLRFGVSINQSAAPEAGPVREAQRAEELGFDFVSVTDHMHGTRPTHETWTLLTWLAGPTPAAAQTDNAPKIEVAAGPSLLRNGATAPSFSLYGGWQAEVSGNFNKHIGLTADFSGEYRSISGARISQYHYLFGPQFAVRRNRATGFAHALVGADTLRAAGNSTSGFALGVGGGLDVNVGRRIAIRIVQADYLPTRVSNLWFRDFRLGMGIVFKFGGS